MPGHRLMLPAVSLAWATRATGHDILFATPAFVTGAAAVARDTAAQPSPAAVLERLVATGAATR
ncbi:hypothetical protein ACQP0I_02365 [Micromonospora carbonacea]|uniref:hypothetical protein n=1 Tax=Micromonospora carbonacea TaxID=47853 RepID=UPI003714E595